MIGYDIIFTFILRICETLLKNHVFTIKSGPCKGLKRRFGFGFKPRHSLTKTKEERFLMSMDFKGKTIYDIGAYVGLYTMFFARAVGKSGKVLAFEPHPKSYQEILYNVKLNKFTNVTVKPYGLGKNQKVMNFTIDPIYPARSTFELDKAKQVSKKSLAKTVKVNVVSLDGLMGKDNLPKPDFIKIDVEGIEIDTLYGMEKTIDRYQPTIFLEIHGIIHNVIIIQNEIIEFFISKQYSIYHVESDTNVMPPLSSIIKGHLLCKYNWCDTGVFNLHL